ncbi:ABC transporter substrate-binding protein [Legionella anisa]|uniref:Amino acid ABC transporter substrate-binding protein n=1 Tax=Legionella anisa TaxID=28082 RepID=A0AAX0WRP0_9GAMM|nr:ABC transporter substrate-binding protein [Legionella anisa]AWN74891.1 amino acid ABC transporter substrate-binding protein [Legionella anisa]KTC68977.1 glutamine-binding periplasmic protein precursor [Legionella anisa]MCW8424907.1 ABC transporter substrate-binding protein [Legionella anisa]MCW8445973.1 ABC transporter substrate-binding protein [Legionella anisa]PNL61151.1 amino acid ABC transporter substrate-binding protein [Legionella anisa]
MNHFLKLIILVATFFIYSCEKKDDADFLHFATAAEYPPFEYSDHGEIKGFDIDLAKLIAKELGKKAVFDNMQFSTVLPAISSGQDDIAIATISVTDARKVNFDFSEPYYFEGMASVYHSEQPITTPSQLKGKKVAVQLGSIMEIWLRENYPQIEITALDNNNQAVEALIAGHVDVVLMDGAQGKIFSKKNARLSYSVIAKADHGYALAVKKGSPLTIQINKALQKLRANGEIQKLEHKWLKDSL